MFDIKTLFINVLSMSTIASIVFLLILLARKCLKHKISFCKLSLLWIIFIIVLIFPIKFSSKLSIKNYIPESNKISINMSKVYKSNTDSMILSDNTKVVKENIDYIKIFSFVWILIAVGSILKDIILYITILFLKSSKDIPKHFYEKLIDCKEKLGIYSNVKLIIQDKVKTPSLYGFINPKILLTEETLNLSNEELECIFIHELNHYKKFHNIFYFAIKILESIYWFNPIVYFAGKLIRQDLEFVTDNLVIKGGIDVKKYSKTIVKVACFTSINAYGMPSICSSKKEIERRIVQMKEKSFDSKYAYICLAFVILMISIVTISLASNKVNEAIDDGYNIFTYSGDSTENINKLVEPIEKENNNEININKSQQEDDEIMLEPFEENNVNVTKSEKENEDQIALKLIEVKNVNINEEQNSNDDEIEIVLPLKNIKVSAKFENRVHPITGENIFHSGIDLVGNTGDEVMAIRDGKVIFADYDNGGKGLTVKIEHEDGSVSTYAHGSKILVEVGDEVKAEDIIMLVGSTGMSTGPHLHFEMQNKDGEYIDVNQLIK